MSPYFKHVHNAKLFTTDTFQGFKSNPIENTPCEILKWAAFMSTPLQLDSEINVSIKEVKDQSNQHLQCKVIMQIVSLHEPL